MNIAVLYNSADAQLLQRRGPVAHEFYLPGNIARIVAALRENGHEVIAVEADRYVIDRLASFFGSLSNDRWPGLVFNLAFGIQGHLRYCHMPALLEMLGLPYLGSGPLGQALSSDKPTAKAVFGHAGLPTPDFVVFHSAAITEPALGYPLIVKPVGQASSLGLKLVHNEEELGTAVRENLRIFDEPVMAECFVGGREINVSVLGNRPGEVLPPVEVVLGEEGSPIYTSEDKDGTARRQFKLECPANVSTDLATEAQRLALEAFAALSCRDWARIEFRIDGEGRLQLLEVNTIPGLGILSSLPAAAKQAGIKDLPALVQRLVDIAVERYNGEPAPMR
jgi:D-alanine-D-alanine ligase